METFTWLAMTWELMQLVMPVGVFLESAVLLVYIRNAR